VSSFRSIEQAIQTNRHLAAAVLAIDGYERARTVAIQARHLLMTLEPPQPVASPLDTGEVTEDWLDADCRYRSAADEFEARRRGLDSLATDAEGQAHSLVAGSVDTILKRLDAELQAVVAAAAELATAKLDHARTAAEAISRGPAAADAWRELAELAPRVTELRDAQQKIYVSYHPALFAQSRTDYSGDALASDLAISNLDDLWPNWRDRPPQRMELSGFGNEPRREPWPADDEAARLLWLATSSAHAWIPTARQVESLHRRRAEKRRAEEAADRDARRRAVFGDLGGRKSERQLLNQQHGILR
jgi:hypothetical protein